jgi:hypothetical protein
MSMKFGAKHDIIRFYIIVNQSDKVHQREILEKVFFGIVIKLNVLSAL